MKIETIKDILGGLAILIGVLALIAWGAAVSLGNINRDKEMTTLCVEKGFDGWDADKGCIR